MTTTAPHFRELDELVLHLKGLVLARDVRRHADAGREELAMFSDEIRRARERLAMYVKAEPAA
ncbi:MAG TPA: hypothetical protein VNR63_06195 [Gaiellaceae bacterium]|jgi:hypothetical protein|nr:hypothetical protein [Gaiellaceae bacterium]